MRSWAEASQQVNVLARARLALVDGHHILLLRLQWRILVDLLAQGASHGVVTQATLVV